MNKYPFAHDKKCPNGSCGSEDISDFIPLGSHIPKGPHQPGKEVPILRYIYKCRKRGKRFEAMCELPREQSQI